MIDKRGLNLNVFSKVKRPVPNHRTNARNVRQPHYSTNDVARKSVQNWETAQREYYDALEDLARKKQVYNTYGTPVALKQLQEAEIRARDLYSIIIT